MKKVLLSLGVVAILAACGGAESAMSDLANAAAQADSLAKITADSLQAAADAAAALQNDTLDSLSATVPAEGAN